MNLSILARRLRAAREAKGLTQLEAGRLLGISNANLSAYELGKREPDYETLVKIAALYDCATDYLLGRVNHPHGRLVDPSMGTKVVSWEETGRILPNPTDDLIYFLRGRQLTEEDVEAVKDLLEARRIRRQREAQEREGREQGQP